MSVDGIMALSTDRFLPLTHELLPPGVSVQAAFKAIYYYYYYYDLLLLILVFWV